MLNIIYNPVAGKGKAVRAQEILRKKLCMLKIEHCFYKTQRGHGAQAIARELTARGETRLVIIGGDGTVHEALNGMTDPGNVILGVIPCGSGNDFAAAAGIPTVPEKALSLILDSAPKYTDYLECSGVRGLNVIGAGIDVEILRRAYQARFLKGSLNYFVSLLASLIHFEQYRFTSKRDERAGRHEGLIVCACNGRRIGGGIGICPEAICDDGQLDVVIVQDVRKSMVPKALVQLARGRILHQRYTLHEHAEHLRVTFDGPTPLQIDGEIYENIPFDVRVVSRVLRMYRP